MQTTKLQFFKPIYSFILGLVLVLSFSSCDREGPEGPAGRDGNANIISKFYTVNPDDWFDDPNTGGWFAEIFVNEISQGVINGGLVKVFQANADETEWFALPYSFGTLQYNYSIATGFVFIDVTDVDLIDIDNPGVQQFRIVILPPAVMRSAPSIPETYHELMETFSVDEI
jgi:hypothetical protein